ncbi:MAG TPA: hypothetical protein VD846_03340 [Allosphingosinicella sp.]|nr:hypothetical protein [Allosphingosinicella sp.]
MKRKDILIAAVAAFAAMLLYCLYASDRRICFDAPCGTIENVIHFMSEEGWVIGLSVFPVALLAVWTWNRATGRQE